MIVRNAFAYPLKRRLDIGVKGGMIVAMDEVVREAADEELDVFGSLVLPPFVNPNLELEGEAVGKAGVEEVLLSAVKKSVVNGITYVKVRVEVGSKSDFKAVLRVAEGIQRIASVVLSVDIAAMNNDCSKHRLVRYVALNLDQGDEELLEKALELSARMNVGLDVHFSGKSVAALEAMLERVASARKPPRVLLNAPLEGFSKLSEEALATAKSIGAFLVVKRNYYSDFGALRRLRESGLDVCLASTTSCGSYFEQYDPLEVALCAARSLGTSALEWIADCLTFSGAKALSVASYGMREGCEASFCVLDATNLAEAVRKRAVRTYVFRKGELVAKSDPPFFLIHHGGLRFEEVVP